jgi:hypothetical protein
VNIALARLDASSGKKEQARGRLDNVVERSRRGGYQQFLLEGKRDLIGLEAGTVRDGRLSDLQNEAKQGGFELIAFEIADMKTRRTNE